MTMQPASPQDGITGAEHLLFTPGPRLGWAFRDRRRLISRYAEPQPDPQAAVGLVAARHARAQRAWRFSLRWVARLLLPLAVALYALGALAREVTHRAHAGPLAVLPVTLAAVGVAWPACCLVRLVLTRAGGPGRAHQAALREWRKRADKHERAELGRLDAVSEWTSASSFARRTDVYGGTLGGWQSLLAVHGASVLAERPLLVADFSGQLASDRLTALARRHGVQGAVYLLPGALSAAGVLTGLAASQLANAIAEAIHDGTSGGTARADRAVDVRVIMRLATTLGGGLTLARLAAAVRAALGQPVSRSELALGEWELIGGDLFGDAYRAQIGPSLVRLDAFLSDLARHVDAGTPQPARPAWYTCLALEPGERGAAAELLATLTVQWLTIQVTRSTATAPAVIIAGADEITRDHLEALAGACERRGVPLTLLFRHLRDDATALIGGAAATAFMRLGDHHEAAQAASFIGRHHSFTISGWTATYGGEHSTTRTRGYEYAVEPAVLQNLPGNALLLSARGTAGPGLLAVECDPRIITLPGAAASLGARDTAGLPGLSRTGPDPAARAGRFLPGADSRRHQFPWCSGTSLTSGNVSTSRAANTRNTCAWTRPG
jgi:hypothetical protein